MGRSNEFQILALALLMMLSIGIADAVVIKTKWVAVTTQTSAGVITDDSNIYSVAESGEVAAFSRLTGARLWIYNIGSKVFVSPVMYGDTIYIGAENGLYAVSTSGKSRGSITFNSSVMTPLISSEGNIIAITKSGEVNIVAAGDQLTRSRLLRLIALPGETESSAVMYAGKMYAFLTDGRMVSADPFTGISSVIYDSGRSVWRSMPIVVNDVLYVGAGRYFMGVSTTGNLTLSKELGGVLYSPSYSDGVFYVGSDDSNLYAISPQGDVLWKFQADDAIRTQPLITTNSIYVASHDKKLYSLTRGGKTKWSILLSDWPSTPVIIDGVLFTVSYDGTLAAVPTSACSISVPEQNASVLPRISMAGSAYADAGVKSVELRTVPGDWYSAEGTSDWTLMLPVSGFPEGQVDVECRITDQRGNVEIPPYESKSYSFIFSEEKLPKINATAPKSSNVKAPINIQFFTGNGSALTGLTVTVGTEKYNVTDPGGKFVYVSQNEGEIKLFAEKPNYQSKTITINVTKPLIQPIYVILALFIIVGTVIYMSMRRGRWR